MRCRAGVRRRAGPVSSSIKLSLFAWAGWALWNQCSCRIRGKHLLFSFLDVLWGYIGPSSNTWEHTACLREGPPGPGGGCYPRWCLSPQTQIIHLTVDPVNLDSVKLETQPVNARTGFLLAFLCLQVPCQRRHQPVLCRPCHCISLLFATSLTSI